MGAKKIIGFGGKQERSTDGVEFVKVIGCKGLAIPKVETEYLDATDLDSLDDFREWAKGLKDGGVIEMPCHYSSAGYAQQLADEAAAEPIYYRVTLRPAADQTTGDVFEYRGFPTPAVESGDLGELIGMMVSVRTTGGVEWTPGTPKA